MRQSFRFFWLALFLILFSLACRRSEDSLPKYVALHDFIWNTQFIDVHSHPEPGPVKYDGNNYYPVLEPMISRPYFPVDKTRISVVDTLEAEALKALYGYTKDDVTESDLPELERLSLKFWEPGNREALNKAMDICGIEKVFANQEKPGEDLDKGRFLWVPFVDFLIYPFDPSAVKSISPFFRQAQKRYYEEGKDLPEKFNIKINDLGSYLRLVDAVLSHYKTNDARALKFASAYIRTLWFDDVDEDEAAAIFREAGKAKLTDKNEYKKIQDFIARYICAKAGELDLPVHFHTGFGYVATLRNLDSNPLNLESIFSDMRFEKTRFVMLHSGYPWGPLMEPMLEKKNVFVEFSAMNWMVYWDNLAELLYQWLSYHNLAGKIMFGSDAGTPVFYWIAAENSRRALYMALSRLVDLNRFDEDMAILIARKIMRDNAIRVHKLD
ncbi:MAG: amidohydrolase [Candidatus Aminicenantes bacterium]|nr:amidohydrolase [Candidatus Aminicenantes bacterium]